MSKLWGNQYRTTMVCIDEYENHIPRGRLLNPGADEPIGFYGGIAFLRSMDAMLNDMRFPEPFMQTRSFFESPQEPISEPAAMDNGPDSGALATFGLKVLFRQNASWQGSVTWLEGRREENFRSVLELLLLMDSALTEAH